ncbi:MAG: 2-hydroxyacyl-CoA dehydratase family protein [Eubacteriales bacterium]|nr:2-hydroxyacyl-CoA dehydratase family protein [Eubacteriales bacterium]
MDKQGLEKLIATCHDSGKRTAVYFCSHVPQELLIAANMNVLKLPYTKGLTNHATEILPKNVCPMVKNCCDICESELLDDVDLIIGETSCDGKKKLYELISTQDKLYFYQIPQGEDRNYVLPLIYSESKYLVKELKKRFDIEISDKDIQEAAKLVEAERNSIRELMELGKCIPPATWGMKIYEALEKNRELSEIKERTQANLEAKEALLAANTSISLDAIRILITGCPLGGVYEKILSAVENNGGVVVCFENCEVLKSATRSFDYNEPDPYQALAKCYQNTACALMSPNNLRIQLIEQLVEGYSIDGILDITLQTCHPYTVERYKIMRHCKEELHIPYMAIETDTGDADISQLTTRITAFLEMI